MSLLFKNLTEYQNKLVEKLLVFFKDNGCEIIDVPIILVAQTNQFTCGHEPPIYYPEKNKIILSKTNELDFGKFIYEVSHELFHKIVSNNILPQKIKWINEIIASNSSFFILDYFEDLKIQRDRFFKLYKEEILNAIPPISIENGNDFIKNNLNEMIDCPNIVYTKRTGLNRLLHDNKIDIFIAVNIFKDFISNTVSHENQHALGFVEYLKSRQATTRQVSESNAPKADESLVDYHAASFLLKLLI